MKYITPIWPAPRHIKALITHKQAHDLSHDLIPIATTLRSDLKLPSDPVILKQTHSTIVLDLALAKAGDEADASFTNKTNTICAVLTADCLPILLCDEKGQHVAAIHAGWRGLLNGMIESTVHSLPVPSTTLYAYLGPAISQIHFEVGRDVYDAFTSKHPPTANYFTKTGRDKWHADLYGIAKFILQNLNVNAIYGGEYCTYRDKELFYSYRRDHGQTGRMVSMIWIAE